MTSLLSIVTVCRNDLDGLRRTYASISRQLGADYEWIVVDGASTDGTLEYLGSLPEGVAKWASEPDRGIYDAMNKGIAGSKGEFCLFLNAGDELANDDTVKLIAECISNSVGIIYGDAIEVADSLMSYKPAFRAGRFWYSMFTHHQSICYRRQNLGDGYDLTFRLAADWALTSRLIMSGVKAIYLPVAICRFYRGGASDRENMRKTANSELWRVYREIHGRNLLVASTLYAAKRLGNVLRFSAGPLYARLRMRWVADSEQRKV